MPYISRQFSDLNLLFTIHPVKKDVSLLYNENAIKESIKNLIFTKHYERPFHPEIGSPINSLLFENGGPIDSIMIKRVIEDVITNFEPRVRLIDVNVVFLPISHYLEISIIFQILNNPKPVTLNLILEKLR